MDSEIDNRDFIDKAIRHPELLSPDGALRLFDCVQALRAEIDRLKKIIVSNITSDKEWTAVAQCVLHKIEEIHFKTNRNQYDPFADNNLPTITPKSYAVQITIEDYKKFRDDFSLMTAWLAWHFKTDKVAPINLIAPLLEATQYLPTNSNGESYAI